jgi:hypothetical protein
MLSTPQVSEIRALSTAEVDEVSGGFISLIYYGWCALVGIASGLSIGLDGPSGSALGDYPTGSKDAG